MKLTAKQLADFEEQGYIFLPECFSHEEVEISVPKPRISTAPTGRKSGVRRAVLHAPPSPHTPTTRHSASWEPIRA